jgi:hypothetical protein
MKNSANKFRVRRATKFRVKDILYFYTIKNRFIWQFGCKVERLLYYFTLLWSYVTRLFEMKKNKKCLLRFLVTLPAL